MPGACTYVGMIHGDPKEAIQRLHTAEGERLLLIESPDGAFQLVPPGAANSV